MKKIVIYIALILFVYSCSEEKSGNLDLKEVTVNDISNSQLTVEKTSLDKTPQKIYIFLGNDLTNVDFPLTLNTSVSISKGAQTNLNETGDLIFNSADEVKELEIIAENGNTTTWLIFLVHKQLQNSNFETWFSSQGLNGIYFNEIGNSIEKSFWATANLGTSTYSIYGSKPLEVDNNTLVQIKTDSVLSLPITAGTIFTGYFYLNGAISNPDDPKKATLFGSPFIYKPTSFKVKYKYSSGDWYKQAALIDPNNIFGGFTQVGISGEDKCAIYAILENRTENATTEIARAELFSPSTDDILEEVIIPFEYTSQLEPTHITVVFSSSKDGDLWRGAVGSTLVIDNLEFIYE